MRGIRDDGLALNHQRHDSPTRLASKQVRFHLSPRLWRQAMIDIGSDLFISRACGAPRRLFCVRCCFHISKLSHNIQVCNGKLRAGSTAVQITPRG